VSILGGFELKKLQRSNTAGQHVGLRNGLMGRSMGLAWVMGQTHGSKPSSSSLCKTCKHTHTPLASPSFTLLTCTPSFLTLSFVLPNTLPAAVGRPGVAAPPPELLLLLNTIGHANQNTYAITPRLLSLFQVRNKFSKDSNTKAFNTYKHIER
jgi:hypothetical protein